MFFNLKNQGNCYFAVNDIKLMSLIIGLYGIWAEICRCSSIVLILTLLIDYLFIFV